jgi:hypothetical protein
MIPGKNLPEGTLTPYDKIVKIYQVKAKNRISVTKNVSLFE